MTTSVDETDAASAVSWEPSLPRLPRPAAVANLVEQLERRGLSSDASKAIAAGVADPDDARRRLGEPARLRVQGGTLLVIETAVWTPAVSIFPVNPREAGQRRYPIGGGAEDVLFTSLRPARNRYTELAITADSPDHLAERIRNAEEWLGVHNPLSEDIAGEGILQPLMIAALSVAHLDGADSITLLSAVDGSSRSTGAHMLLRLDGADLAYNRPPGSRALRQTIGRVLRLGGEQSWDSLIDDDQAALRALVAPARIIVGYERDTVGGVSFDTAVRNLIGLTHIRPPRAYGSAVENEAKADAVLDYLAYVVNDGAPYLSTVEHEWFVGSLTPEQALVRGLSDDLDVRACDIARALLYGKNRTARRVNNGIRALTAQRAPDRNDRVDIAVELILRPLATMHAGDRRYSIQARRAALQRAFRLPEIFDQTPDPIFEGRGDSEWTLEQVRDTALSDIREEASDIQLSDAQLELAIKAAYYMVTSEPMALRREGYGADDRKNEQNRVRTEERSLPVILRAMLSRRQGVHQAYAIIFAGRRDEPLHEVDQDGATVLDDNDGPIVLDDPRVRAMYSSAPVSKATVGGAGARRRWNELTAAFDTFDAAVRRMGAVKTSTRGRHYVDENGWNAAAIEPLRKRLDRLDRDLGTWADRDYYLHDDQPDATEREDRSG